MSKKSRKQKDIRIIIIGESALIETTTSTECIEHCANHPDAADYDASDLIGQIAEHFDGDFARHSEEMKQHCIFPTACCLLGKLADYKKILEWGGRTFVVAVFRKEGDYSGFVMPSKIPTDTDPFEVAREGFAFNLDQLEAVGFDADSQYHKQVAPLRETQTGAQTIH